MVVKDMLMFMFTRSLHRATTGCDHDPHKAYPTVTGLPCQARTSATNSGSALRSQTRRGRDTTAWTTLVSRFARRRGQQPIEETVLTWKPDATRQRTCVVSRHVRAGPRAWI